MIRLGHIVYSNCFPVHALLAGGAAPRGICVVPGIPSQLNRALETGEIDVAPSSSIEYARHLDRYRLLPDFVIGSDGPVGSILFECMRPIAEIDGAIMRLPTASATSVVLLKILLRLKYAIEPQFEWFDQEQGGDPLGDGAAAALWIGDVALRRSFPADRLVLDLGAEWKNWTGLPFVFAAWQTGAPASRDAELRALSATLRESYDYFLQNAAALAGSHAQSFGLDAARLLAYWRSLRYQFTPEMQQGLLRYYELAAQLNETPVVSQLRWVI